LPRSPSPPTPNSGFAPGASPFDLAPAFREESDTGSMRLGEFEAMYEKLFAESIETGEIGDEERVRLDLAARALGLDASRVVELEGALMRAWETFAGDTLTDAGDPGTLADRAPPSLAPQAPARQPSDFFVDDEAPTLSRASAREVAIDDPNAELLELFRIARKRGDADAELRIAAVLVRRNVANAEQQSLVAAARSSGPIRPKRALTSDAWHTYLFDSEEDRNTGELFAVVASAALVGRVSAMRRDGTLPKLDPHALADAAASTVSAARAVGWAAATLGLRAPPVFLAPEADSGFEMVTATPPATRAGAKVLSGLGATALAFAAGRHMSWYREEHFVCSLVPSVPYLEDLFIAALRLGSSSVELAPEAAARATIIADAMRPCLEASQLERLRRLVARFLARGGIANLKRWARAADRTACRAGLLLCGDLDVACNAVVGEAKGDARVRALEEFWASESAGELRQRLGIAVE
jgi:hypothetical protein